MRALIVDDSNFIREHLRRHLERLGWECEEARHGGEALSCVLATEECGSSFNLMLVDVNMPVMDGLACVQQLRERQMAPHTRVMMVTTEADNSYIERALQHGADEFLMKPFSLQGLREKLALLGLEAVA